MLRIDGAIQNYQWGTEGKKGQVASLLKANGDEVEEEQNYAELWMGTHCSGPSKLKWQKNVSLQDWIVKNQTYLGLSQLPYLFKVLSVGKALSIQSHPNKQQAEQLHRKFPKLYKDDNHKPEMAIAVTDFTALCSFLPASELQLIPDLFPDLKGCVKSLDKLRTVQNNNTLDLKECFAQLMHAENQTVRNTVVQIILRIRSKHLNSQTITEKEKLMLSLQKQFPYDVGILVAPFLNLVQLKPGQAIYLEANQPHAYIFGDCIECMATSDNVIRAGLTPKHIDKDGLIATLSYTLEKPLIIDGAPINQYTKLYQPPFDEFEVHKLDLPAHIQEKVIKLKSPQIWLVFEGEGNVECNKDKYLDIEQLEYNLFVKRGDIMFVPSDTDITLKSGTQGLSIWGASINQKALGYIQQQQQDKENRVEQQQQSKSIKRQYSKSLQRSSTFDSVHVMA